MSDRPLENTSDSDEARPNAVNPVRDEPLDLDALMEAQGGAVAARWSSIKDQGQLYDLYRAAALAYRMAQDLPRLKVEVIAALRLAEGALARTPLTPKLEEHGWSAMFVQYMADLLADYRNQIETDIFNAERDADYAIGRSMMDQISPMWYDHDEIKEAIQHARELLRAYQVRLQGAGASSER